MKKVKDIIKESGWDEQPSRDIDVVDNDFSSLDPAKFEVEINEEPLFVKLLHKPTGEVLIFTVLDIDNDEVTYVVDDSKITSKTLGHYLEGYFNE